LGSGSYFDFKKVTSVPVYPVLVTLWKKLSHNQYWLHESFFFEPTKYSNNGLKEETPTWWQKFEVLKQ